MLISTKGRYALRVMIDLAEHRSGEFISLKEIAQRQDGKRREFVVIEETPQLNARGEEVYVHLSGGKGKRDFSLIPENAERQSVRNRSIWQKKARVPHKPDGAIRGKGFQHERARSDGFLVGGMCGERVPVIEYVPRKNRHQRRHEHFRQQGKRAGEPDYNGVRGWRIHTRHGFEHWPERMVLAAHKDGIGDVARRDRVAIMKERVFPQLETDTASVRAGFP